MYTHTNTHTLQCNRKTENYNNPKLCSDEVENFSTTEKGDFHWSDRIGPKTSSLQGSCITQSAKFPLCVNF